MKGAVVRPLRPMPDALLMWIALILCLIGLAVSYYATPQIANPVHTFIKQSVALAIGIFFVFVTQKIPFTTYKKPLFLYGLLTVTALLLFGLFFVQEIKGARRWYRLGSIGFQPTYLAVFLLIALVSERLATKPKTSDEWYHVLKVTAPISLASLLLIYLQGDLGNTVILAATVLFLFLMGGLPLRFSAVVLFTALVLTVLAIWFAGYRRERILSFFNSQSYQLTMAHAAMASGGWFGSKGNTGISRHSYLPEANSDFAFSSLGEKGGLFATLGVLGLYFAFLIRSVWLLSQVEDTFGHFLGIGILAWLMLQMVIHVSVNLNFVPTKGLVLPFISKGGSALVFMLALLGILLRIGREVVPENPVIVPKRVKETST
jgi:cell division protein FtsW